MQRDLEQALHRTMACRGVEVMRRDSVRAYKAMAHHDASALTIMLEDKTFRSYLEHDAIRNVAYIACEVRARDGAYDVSFRGDAPCSASMLFALSDQRPALVLSIMAAMSLLWSLRPLRRRTVPQLCATGAYGGLRYDDASDRFVTAQGGLLHLTPMQLALMKMFFESESHTLSKQAICDALWPKKPDANDTLYALIRRLKPVVEAHSELRIESERGKAYALKVNDVGRLT